MDFPVPFLFVDGVFLFYIFYVLLCIIVYYVLQSSSDMV